MVGNDTRQRTEERQNSWLLSAPEETQGHKGECAEKMNSTLEPGEQFMDGKRGGLLGFQGSV